MGDSMKLACIGAMYSGANYNNSNFKIVNIQTNEIFNMKYSEIKVIIDRGETIGNIELDNDRHELLIDKGLSEGPYYGINNISRTGQNYYIIVLGEIEGNKLLVTNSLGSIAIIPKEIVLKSIDKVLNKSIIDKIPLLDYTDRDIYCTYHEFDLREPVPILEYMEKIIKKARLIGINIQLSDFIDFKNNNEYIEFKRVKRDEKIRKTLFGTGLVKSSIPVIINFKRITGNIFDTLIEFGIKTIVLDVSKLEYIPSFVTWDSYDTSKKIDLILKNTDEFKIGAQIYLRLAGSTLIKAVYFEDGLYRLPNSILNSSSVEFVRLPESIRELDEYALANCYRLRSINLPDKIRFIGDYAFTGCNSLNISKLPKDLSVLGRQAFRNCYLATINEVQQSLQECSEGVFENNLIIPKSLF